MGILREEWEGLKSK